MTAEEGSDWVYLCGKFPTQTDRQVYDAIQHINVSDYPSLHSWKILMEISSEEERRQWPTYKKQIKNLNSDLLLPHSVTSVGDAKSKLFFED